MDEKVPFVKLKHTHGSSVKALTWRTTLWKRKSNLEFMCQISILFLPWSWFSGKWLHLKGNYHWRRGGGHFPLNHDYGSKRKKFEGSGLHQLRALFSMGWYCARALGIAAFFSAEKSLAMKTTRLSRCRNKKEWTQASCGKQRNTHQNHEKYIKTIKFQHGSLSPQITTQT